MCTCAWTMLQMESTRWLYKLTFIDSLRNNAVVCLLTLLVALCRSEQLTADSDEKCWKHRGRVKRVCGRVCRAFMVMYGWERCTWTQHFESLIVSEGKGLTWVSVFCLYFCFTLVEKCFIMKTWAFNCQFLMFLIHLTVVNTLVFILLLWQDQLCQKVTAQEI